MHPEPLSGDLVVPTTPAQGSRPCSNLTDLPTSLPQLPAHHTLAHNLPTGEIGAAHPSSQSWSRPPFWESEPAARQTTGALHLAPRPEPGLSQPALPQLPAPSSGPPDPAGTRSSGPPVHAACTHPFTCGRLSLREKTDNSPSPQGVNYCRTECELTASPPTLGPKPIHRKVRTPLPASS